MLSKYFHHAISVSIATMALTPLMALSAQQQTHVIKSSSNGIVAVNTLSSLVTYQKSKVMTNLSATIQHPNFSGKWVLDNKASDPVDEILKAQGVSWLERQAIKSAKIIQDIKQDGTQVTVTIGTVAKSRTEVLKLDGSAQVTEGDRLGNVKSKTFWDTDGSTLVSTIEPTESSQNFTEFKVSRRLQDGGKTLAQTMEMKLKNGQTLKANRIFRKAS